MASIAATENHSAPARLPGETVRLSMSLVIWAWAFGAVFFAVSAGAIYASFARQLGVSESVFGFLAGVSPLMSFIQIPAARLLETKVRPRRMMLTCGLLGRCLWVVAAGLPLLVKYGPNFLPEWLCMPREWLMPAFVVCVCLSGIFQAFTGPSFFAWMSSLVPARVNSTFWAKRYQVGTLVAIFATVLGGLVADKAADIKEWTNGDLPPLMLYSILLVLASICGVMDIALFWRVREPEELGHFKARDQMPGLFSSLAAPLKEPQVRRYLQFAAMWVIGSASIGPLLWLHCLETFEWSRTQTGIVLAVAPMAGMAVSSLFWGQSVRNYGLKPNARFMSMAVVFVPICWTLATRDSYRLMLGLNFLNGMFAASFDMCNTNFMTRTCPQLPRPTLVALFGIVAGISAAAASWLSGVAAQLLDGFKFTYWGHDLINYHVVFAVALVFRLINAFFITPRLEEPEAVATRTAVRESATAAKESARESATTLYSAFASRFSRLFGAREE